MTYYITLTVASAPSRRIFYHQRRRSVSRDGPLVSLRGLLGRILHVWVTPWLIRKFVSGVTGQNSLRGVGGS